MFGIPLSALPRDSMIENMPASFFRRHPVGSLAGAALFVILIGINSLLWLNIRRRKAAERANASCRRLRMRRPRRDHALKADIDRRFAARGAQVRQRVKSAIQIRRTVDQN